MSLFQSKNKSMVIVSTKKELERAIKRKEPEIKAVGEAANKIRWMKRISKAQIALLIPALMVSVIPNPASPIAFASIASIAGADIATIILASGVSISLIIAISKGYNQVELGSGDIKLTLKR